MCSRLSTHVASTKSAWIAGDYYQALRVMEHIELDKKGLYSRVPACQVTVFYYVSFSYMMMGRYKVPIHTCGGVGTIGVCVLGGFI